MDKFRSPNFEPNKILTTQNFNNQTFQSYSVTVAELMEAKLRGDILKIFRFASATEEIYFNNQTNNSLKECEYIRLLEVNELVPALTLFCNRDGCQPKNYRI